MKSTCLSIDQFICPVFDKLTGNYGMVDLKWITACIILCFYLLILFFTYMIICYFVICLSKK